MPDTAEYFLQFRASNAHRSANSIFHALYIFFYITYAVFSISSAQLYNRRAHDHPVRLLCHCPNVCGDLASHSCHSQGRHTIYKPLGFSCNSGDPLMGSGCDQGDQIHSCRSHWLSPHLAVCISTRLSPSRILCARIAALTSASSV